MQGAEPASSGSQYLMVLLLVQRREAGVRDQHVLFSFV